MDDLVVHAPQSSTTIAFGTAPTTTRTTTKTIRRESYHLEPSDGDYEGGQFSGLTFIHHLKPPRTTSTTSSGIDMALVEMETTSESHISTWFVLCVKCCIELNDCLLRPHKIPHEECSNQLA